jgi:ribosomal-protein-alanine N-acetyltransferase
MRQLHFPLNTFPLLETANLHLRELVPADTEAVFRLFSDDEVTRFYDFDSFTSVGQAADLIARQSVRFARGEGLRWGITQRDMDVVIGTVGLLVEQKNATGGLGYDLARPYWRLGIMSEALSMIVRFGFRTVNLNRQQALVVPGNIASLGLLKKLGFTEEGLLRQHSYFKGRYQDVVSLSLLREEMD